MGFLLSLIPSPALIKPIVAALVIGLIAGFGVGWHTKAKFAEAEQAQAVLHRAEQATGSVKESNKVETETVQKKADVEVRYQTITKEVIKYVPKTTVLSCKDGAGNTVATALNIGAVRLLNSDPTSDKNLQPAGISDAEVQTTTEVGLQELSEYVVEIKRQYEDLAIDHDALVDYDTWYQENIDGK